MFIWNCNRHFIRVLYWLFKWQCKPIVEYIEENSFQKGWGLSPMPPTHWNQHILNIKSKFLDKSNESPYRNSVFWQNKFKTVLKIWEWYNFFVISRCFLINCVIKRFKQFQFSFHQTTDFVIGCKQRCYKLSGCRFRILKD